MGIISDNGNIVQNELYHLYSLIASENTSRVITVFQNITSSAAYPFTSIERNVHRKAKGLQASSELQRRESFERKSRLGKAAWHRDARHHERPSGINHSC